MIRYVPVYPWTKIGFDCLQLSYSQAPLSCSIIKKNIKNNRFIVYSMNMTWRKLKLCLQITTFSDNIFPTMLKNSQRSYGFTRIMSFIKEIISAVQTVTTCMHFAWKTAKCMALNRCSLAAIVQIKFVRAPTSTLHAIAENKFTFSWLSESTSTVSFLIVALVIQKIRYFLEVVWALLRTALCDIWTN